MMRHSAIAYADDDPCIPNIAFAGDAWLRYIPIRMPDTLTVTEGVPAGITAILINRAHAQNDICLPIRAHEMRLLEGVDGTRTIGELFKEECEREVARSLFERLWWHDQIVFDACAVPRSFAQAMPSHRDHARVD